MDRGVDSRSQLKQEYRSQKNKFATMDEQQKSLLSISLFGPTTITLGPQQSRPKFRTQTSQWLLAILCIRHGQRVERHWITNLLWPGSPTPNNTLRRCLYDLKRVLGATGAIVDAQRDTILLDIDRIPNVNVDIVSFDRAIAASDLQMAVGLYKGPLLEDCRQAWAGSLWFITQQHRYREECLKSLEALADSAMNQGSSSTAIEFLTTAVTIDPLRETTFRSYLKALVANGDAIKAQRAAVNWQQRISKIAPAVTPSPETIRTVDQIIGRSRSTVVLPNATDSEVPLHLPSARSGTLPRQLTHFIGRHAESESVMEAVLVNPLVTLSGAPGIGKTRLAIEVAERLSDRITDGVFFIDLASISTLDGIIAEIANRTSIPLPPDRPTLDVVISHLRHRDVLIVLDNCEHILEHGVDVIQSLLHECHALRILTTSREVLRLDDEVEWRVQPLALPSAAGGGSQLQSDQATMVLAYDATHLFCQRLIDVNHPFQLTEENATRIIAICQQLEGIPLALVIAASRFRDMTLAEIQAGITNRFSFLKRRSRSSEFRHQTLHGAIEWSYDLLTNEEKSFLSGLSVFVGGCTRESAHSICWSDDTSTVQVDLLLSSLCDKSLLERRESQTGISRYHLLETIREFAEQRGSPEIIAATEKRHIAYFVTFSEEQERRQNSADESKAFAALEEEYANLIAAVRRGIANGNNDKEAGLRLVGAMAPFWRWSRLDEGCQYITQVLEHDLDALPTLWRLKALYRAGSLTYLHGDYHASEAWYDQSFSLANQLRDGDGIATSLRGKGSLAPARNDYAGAYTLYLESLNEYRSKNQVIGTALCLCNLGNLACIRGHYSLSKDHLDECLSIIASSGVNKETTSSALHYRGELALATGDYSAAKEFCESACAIDRKLGTKAAMAIGVLGRVYLAQDDCTTAAELFNEHLQRLQRWGNKRYLARALENTGNLHLRRRNLDSAKRFLRDSMTTLHSLNNYLGIARLLRSLAELAFECGNADNAAVLFAASEALYEEVQCPIPESERERHSSLIRQVRGALEETDFSQAWARGRKLNAGDAAALALNT